MAKPLPLPVWDRQRGTLVQEWMDDHQPHYESEPQRSFTQWVKSQPVYDRKKWARSLKRATSAGSMLSRVRNSRSRATHSVLEQILGSADRARSFSGGPVLLVRLAPVDYHHMHYPDDGTTQDHQRVGRRLWTVNWHALQSKPDILFANERNVNILETRNFGRLGFVEVGALSVGRIAQVHPFHLPFRRGEEKAVFRFGGSAIVVFGERGKWSPSADLLEHTQQNVETLVRLGDCVATAGAQRCVLFQRTAAQAAASAPDYRLPLPPWELPAVSAVEGEQVENRADGK